MHDMTQNHSLPISIIALQETWSIPHPELLSIDNYNLIHNSRPGGMRGGGVGFYVRKELNARITHNINIPKVFECMTITFTLNGKKIAVSSVYRSPSPPLNLTANAQFEAFTQHLETLMQETSSNNTTSFICLDSNIDAHSCNSQHSNYEYFQTIQTNGYIQCINKSTRVQNTANTLIDHILTNSTAQHIHSGTIISDISDHFFTFIVTPEKQTRARVQKVLARNLSNANVERFRLELAASDWTGVLDTADIDESHRLFTDIFNQHYVSCFPETQSRFNKNKHKIHDFMSTALLTSRQTKLKLQKIALKHPTPEHIAEYKAYRNSYNLLVRTSRKKYYEESLNKFKNNPRKTWEIVKDALNSQKTSNTIEKISLQNTTITDSKEISEAFSRHFAGAGKKVAQSINPTLHKPEEFMPPPCEHELHLGVISNAEVVSVLRAMQSKSSQDINGLSMKILKQVAMEVSIPLTHIFNLSIAQGVFPKALKTSRIVPIYKGGNADLCDNYRPIALLNTLTKALEKIVANKLTEHITNHKLLYEGQFGFQHGKNTEQNLIYTISSISNSINNGEYCIGVFLDLKKAFDVCSHEIMLKKLDNFGVRGTALNWFASYLSGRTQCVNVNGSTSEPMEIEGISIIQGGTLGPILFNIYINDLHRSTTMQTALFADDTSALNKGKQLPALIDSTNQELAKMSTWFRANKMAVNTSKTKFIIFHTKGKKIDMQNKHIVFNDNEDKNQQNNNIFELERIHNNHVDKDNRTYKLLGIHLDEHLSFDHNTNVLASKLSRSIYCMSKVKHTLPKKALMHLYFAFVHSHLSYCTTIASITSKSNIDKISKLQKKAIRIATHSQYNAHTAPLLAQHNILPYKDMITQAQLHFMHSIHYNYAPSIFTGLWPRNTDRNIEHSLRNAHEYTIPRANYAFYKKTPPHSFAQAWNTAPTARYHSNPTTFRIQLKHELLQPYLQQAPLPSHYNTVTGTIHHPAQAPAPAQAPIHTQT